MSRAGSAQASSASAPLRTIDAATSASWASTLGSSCGRPFVLLFASSSAHSRRSASQRSRRSVIFLSAMARLPDDKAPAQLKELAAHLGLLAGTGWQGGPNGKRRGPLVVERGAVECRGDGVAPLLGRR